MINEHKFGSFVISGRSYLGDIKIIDGKVHYWEDRKKHTVNFDDVNDLLESGPEVIIVGTGNSGYLEMPAEIKDIILGRRIKLFVDVNVNAVKKYNEAVSMGGKVAALFHATC
ncbi:MAG: MTH938/NDUFAF3 family protein [Candidatus Woesearchaeota archaeon]